MLMADVGEEIERLIAGMVPRVFIVLCIMDHDFCMIYILGIYVLLGILRLSIVIYDSGWCLKSGYDVCGCNSCDSHVIIIIIVVVWDINFGAL